MCCCCCGYPPPRHSDFLRSKSNPPRSSPSPFAHHYHHNTCCFRNLPKMLSSFTQPKYSIFTHSVGYHTANHDLLSKLDHIAAAGFQAIELFTDDLYQFSRSPLFSSILSSSRPLSPPDSPLSRSPASSSSSPSFVLFFCLPVVDMSAMVLMASVLRFFLYLCLAGPTSPGSRLRIS